MHIKRARSYWFITFKGLLPFVEKQIRVLHDGVANRKTRSLFSGAKRWFGNKPNSGTGTSVVYAKDATELQESLFRISFSKILVGR